MQNKNNYTADINELKKAFDLFDTSSNGYVDQQEVKAVIRSLGFDIHTQEVRQLFAELSKKETENISFEEFGLLMEAMLPEENSDEEIRKMFSLFDVNGKGYISFNSLKSVSMQLKLSVTDDELGSMMRAADLDQDGKITYNDFARVMRKSRGDPLDFDSDED